MPVEHAEPAFEKLHVLLLKEFPEDWSLMNRILHEMADTRRRISLHALCILARDAVNLRQDLRGEASEYIRFVKNAVLLIQAKTLDFVATGDNPDGWSLSSNYIEAFWEKNAETMHRIAKKFL
ncbi:hypothetical protein HYT95_01395 [Candidatus Peregrinibacteria bacterium]|nr:hypothetical protein [Candidatus Peregrinibacteria bacterium]